MLPPESRARTPDESGPIAGVLLGLAAATVLSILFLDRPVASWAHGLHKPAWCVWLTWIADVPAPAAVLALTVLVVASLSGWTPPAGARVLMSMAVATLVAVAAVFVMKSAFGRTWPETWVANNPSWIGTHAYGFSPFHGGIGWSAFPSGHIATITAPIAASWVYAARWRPVLVTLPLLVVAGLIGANYHFLGDCVGGALLGVASARSVSMVRRYPPVAT